MHIDSDVELLPLRLRSTNTLIDSCWFTFATLEFQVASQVKHNMNFFSPPTPPSVLREFIPGPCVSTSLPLAGLPALPFALGGTVSPVRRPASSFLLPFPLPLAGEGAEGRREGADPVCRSGGGGMREPQEETQLDREETTDDEAETRQRGGLLFVGDLIPGFSRHRRHFLRLRVGLAFLLIPVLPFSLEGIKNKTKKKQLITTTVMLLSKLTIISTANPACLIGWRLKEAGICQIQVTDGRDGDSVVGVVILHGLRRADYRVLQIIFVLLCSVGRETKAISKISVCKCCCSSSSKLPVFISPRASCLSFSIFTYSLCR